MRETSKSLALTAHGDSDPKWFPAAYDREARYDANYWCLAINTKRRKYCRARAGAGTDHPGLGRCRVHGGNSSRKHGLRSRYKLQIPHLQDRLAKHLAAENPHEIAGEIALLRALTETWLNEKGELLEQLSAWHAQRRLNPEQQNAMYQLIDDYEELTKSGAHEITTRQVELPRLARAAVKHLGDDIPRPNQVPELTDVVKLIGETTRSVERVFTMQAKQAITWEQLKRFLFAIDRILESLITDVELLGRIKEAITRVPV